MKINFDNEAIQKIANEAVRQQAARAQAVYDHVLNAGRGKTADDVKTLLIQEWRATFGTQPTDPELSRAASVLAEGRRIEVRPT